ncbi:MAG TPA: DEAD/DEAH box helicase [Polyangiaceae bacterium]|nr:DEAD/DEAH box helicase [Polyangiaceae bacterium]
MDELKIAWSPSLVVKVEPSDDGWKPYDHQLAAWDAMSRYYGDERKKAGILVVPTGGGKTAIASRWLLQHHIAKGGRVLWFAHRRSLIRQAFATFAKAAHLASPKKELSLITISSEDCKWSHVTKEHDVVFASVQSAVQETNFGFLDLMATQSTGGLMVVVDEAHHAAAPGYRRVLGELQKHGAPLLGLSATPTRMDDDDKKRLWNLFGGIIYEIDKKTLFNKEILATPTYRTVKTNIEFEREFTAEDYAHVTKFGELGASVLGRVAKHSGRNGLIVKHYLEHREIYGQTIVFAADTLHAQTLAKEFKASGVDADYVDYSRRDSQAVMAEYRDRGKPMVLANVEMLTEGFDAPKTRTVFIARPTRSDALLAQMVGRALRGKQAGGNTEAFLVTFVDTWQQFDVLDTSVVVGGGEVPDQPTKPRPPAVLIPISAELIYEAYRLVQSNVKGSFVGVHQCLPYGWYIWEEEFIDDVQRRLVLVFENQRQGFEALDAEYKSAETIPSDVSEDLARDLVRRFFADCTDPLPRWADVQSLLMGRKKGSPVVFYTFKEKETFDPALLAKKFFDGNLGPREQTSELQALWDANGACQLVYRSDFHAFVEDVTRELTDLTPGARRPPAPLKFVESVPKGRTRRWPAGEPGYSLIELKDAVLEQPRHFPEGPPVIKELRYAAEPLRGMWGFFQFANKAIVINPELNSPDVPRYVMEFLLYHEFLHALMPSAGHNREYRAKERLFAPSSEAIADAERRGHVVGKAIDAWRVLAEQYLDTFESYYELRVPGKSIEM